MKPQRLFLTCIIIICVHFAIAQTPGEWTWMSGDNIVAQPSVFGIQGVPDPANKPGGIYEGCEWVDGAGNFYLFGGLDYNFSTQADMWRYNPSTNEWTWLNGPGGTGGLPVYGIRGVAAATNHPGERGFGMLSWIDNSGVFWMYGGYSNLGAIYLADFWKFDISTNFWTWMGGDTLPNAMGNHGVMGVPSPTNLPPPSTENACTWINGDDLWYFGGMSQGGPYMGDMWRYNIPTDEWTWMKGDSAQGAPPVFGTLGVSSPTNFPGARICYSRWKDNNNDFWIFGGSTISGQINDLWRYSIATNEWTWMNGPNTVYDLGDYGTRCVAAPTNRPPSRTEARAAWTDDCGMFWLFGGSGGNGMESDLWKYDITTSMWTWVSGSATGNAVGVYGIKGVSDPANAPGGRQGSHAYKDLSGNLWLLGGYSQFGSMINDLWRFVPDPACGACATTPIALFSAPNHICPGTCTDFINNSVGATSYQWTFAGANPSTSVDQDPVNICYNTPGTYAVTLIASNSNTSDTLMLNNYVTVYPYPPAQGISQSGDTLFAVQGSIAYQWYYNGGIITGATNYFYVAQASGSYNVLCTDANGCEVEAVIFDVVAAVPSIEESDIFAEPNPFSEEIKIFQEGKITIIDNLGQKIIEKVISGSDNKVGLSFLPAGIYFLRLETRKGMLQQKLVKI
jgi:PKD repeat protein